MNAVKLPYRATLRKIQAERKVWQRDSEASEICEQVTKAIFRIERMIRAYHAELIKNEPPVSAIEGQAIKRAAGFALRQIKAGDRHKAIKILERILK